MDEKSIQQIKDKRLTVCESASYLHIAKLIPYGQNPRKDLREDPNALDDLQLSILQNGLFRPFIVFWRTNSKHFDQGTILAGNQRFHALSPFLLNGFSCIVKGDDDTETDIGQEVPITRFMGSDDNAHRIILRDNREQGDWDYSDLATYLKEFGDGDPMFAKLAGFGESELEDLMSLLETPEQRHQEAMRKLGAKSAQGDGEEEWLTMEFRLPESAVSIVENELDRIELISAFDGDLPEDVRRGLALERMAVLSSQTSDLELE